MDNQAKTKLILCLGLFVALLSFAKCTGVYFVWGKLSHVTEARVVDEATIKKTLDTKPLDEVRRDLLLSTIVQQQDARIATQKVLTDSVEWWRGLAASQAVLSLLLAYIFGLLLWVLRKRGSSTT